MFSHTPPHPTGGVGTIEAAQRACEMSSPLVIVEGSGKAADLLAHAWRFLHDDDPWWVVWYGVVLCDVASVDMSQPFLRKSSIALHSIAFI